MASERLIKRRIRSAKNISQITRAMQMVAASKMKKAQALAVSGRPYAEKISEMVRKFVAKIEPEKHPLLKRPVAGKTLWILISTNKGLCGGLNSSLFRRLNKWMNSEELSASSFVSVGKKGESYLVRRGLTLVADFSQNLPFTNSIPALTTLLSEGFIKGEFSKVILIYNNFLSPLKQEPTIKTLLPLTEFAFTTSSSKEEDKKLDFLVEPSIEEIIDPLLFHYLENQIRDAILEAEASEHSARMLAMKNATDSANELIEILTHEYNKARQAKITYEIADIVTARLAVET